MENKNTNILMREEKKRKKQQIYNIYVWTCVVDTYITWYTRESCSVCEFAVDRLKVTRDSFSFYFGIPMSFSFLEMNRTIHQYSIILSSPHLFCCSNSRFLFEYNARPKQLISYKMWTLFVLYSVLLTHWIAYYWHLGYRSLVRN